ncbi:MAG: OmpA family protein [Acidobacteria bacterium]|nr:OmpA family protein [Acidobacteriota bacterium]
MRKIACACIAVLLVSGIAAAQPLQKDDPACKDHPLFTRMPDSWLRSCSEKTFDAHEFATSATAKTTVEGRLWQLTYYPQAAAKSKPSELQILRNFENAVTKIGGKSMYAAKARETFMITQDGKEIWVDLWAEFTGKYGFFIVEKQAMAQDIVANAAALANDLKTTGHVTVEGIYFDTGKAEIKPESAKAIGEIAKMLAADPALKVYVVGHTDTVGVLEANMKLSQDRAAAVMQALVTTHGMAAARLKSFGAGPYAPVASNDTDTGRAKNRRVELVKQ